MIKQAVLLAAGKGTRLLPITRDRPKCMVEVNGKAIVDTLLDALREIAIEEIVVVTGYKSEILERYLRENEDFRWTFIHNERYASTNNILSLHVAKDAIEGPFLLVESDIYLSSGILRPLANEDQILVAPYTAQMDGTGICMGAENQVSEMVIRAHLSRGDSLSSMHKTVNFYSFSQQTWALYSDALDRWVGEGRLDQYYEAVLAELINDGKVQMYGADVGPRGWGEVDDVADLKALEASLQEQE